MSSILYGVIYDAMYSRWQIGLEPHNAVLDWTRFPRRSLRAFAAIEVPDRVEIMRQDVIENLMAALHRHLQEEAGDGLEKLVA